MFDTLVREDRGIWIRGLLDDRHNIGDAGSIPAGFAKILFGDYILFYTIMLYNISKIVYNYFYIISLHQKTVVC